jgi:hypothetical protein
VAGCKPGSGFDGDFEAFGNEGFDGVRKESDASLARSGFFQNCKAQNLSSTTIGPGPLTRPDWAGCKLRLEFPAGRRVELLRCEIVRPPQSVVA